MKKSVYSIPSIAILLVLTLFFGACNTSRGGALRRTSDKDTQESARAQQRDEPTTPQPNPPSGPTFPDPPSDDGWRRIDTNPLFEWESDDVELEEETIGLSISTRPWGARLYLDGEYYGTTPQSVFKLSSGVISIRLEKEGYHPLEKEIYFDATSWESFQFEMERITGTLLLESGFEEANLLYNGHKLSSMESLLGVGQGTLVASRFGYTDQIFPVVIRDRETTRIVAQEWEPAELEVKNFYISRGGFQRDFHRITFRFHTNGPGEAILNILDPQGNLVQSLESGVFSDWREQIVWRISPEQKTLLKPGVYRAVLIPQVGQELNVDFTLDYTLVRRADQLFWSSSQGQLYSPDARILPPGDLGISAGLTAVREAELMHLMMNSSFALGLGEGSQLAMSFAQRLYSDGMGNSWYLNAGFKNRLGKIASLESSWYSTLSLSSFYSAEFYAPPTTDPFTNPAGLKAGLALTLDLGDFNLNLAPELVWAWQTISYSLQNTSEPGIMGYLRSGFTWTTDFADFSLSGALRARNPQNGFGILLPLQLGGSIRFRQDGDWSLNLLSTLDYWSPEVWALTLGFGTSVYIPSTEQLSNNLFPALERPDQ